MVYFYISALTLDHKFVKAGNVFFFQISIYLSVCLSCPKPAVTKWWSARFERLATAALNSILNRAYINT